MNTQTQTENKTETKLNLLENLYIENINIVDFIAYDTNIEDIKNADDLYNELNELNSFLGCSLNQSKLNEYLRNSSKNMHVKQPIEEQELLN